MRPSLVRAVVVGSFAAWLGLTSTARADNPWDSEQRGLAARAVRLARQAEGMLPVLELWDGRDWASAEVTAALLEELAREPRLPAPRRARVLRLLGRARMRQGDLEAHARAVREAGYVTDLAVVGPFRDDRSEGLGPVCPPETAGYDPEARWQGSYGDVAWRKHPPSAGAYVSFSDLMRPADRGCAFAQAIVTADRARPLTVWLGAAGSLQAWWNGSPVLEDPERWHAAEPGRRVAMVGAAQGDNRLLLKVCAGPGDWGLFLRVGDAQGGPARGVVVHATPQGPLPEGHGVEDLPDAPTTTFETLDRAAARGSPAALEALARYLHLTGSDPALARQVAAEAADEAPTVDRLLLASRLAATRAERMRWMARARDRAPDDDRVVLLRAQLIEQGPHPAAAMRVANALRRRHREGLLAAELRGRILGHDLGLNRTALSEVESAIERAPSAALLSLRAELLQHAGETDRAMQARRAHLAADFTAFESRHRLVDDAVERGDDALALRLLQAAPDLWPTHVRRLRWVSRMYAALGRDAAAVRALRRAERVAPRDPVTLLALGKLLLRSGRPEAAAKPLRAAHELLPNNGEIGDLLERTGSEGRPATRWVAGPRALLARRVSGGSDRPFSVLQDLTVVSLEQGGAVSRYRQLAVEVHDAAGIDRWSRHRIAYDPTLQSVDVLEARVHRAGGGTDPARRIERAEHGEVGVGLVGVDGEVRIELPTPARGDVVELQWEVEDSVGRGALPEQWGEHRLVQHSVPVARFDHVVIAPEDTDLYVRVPDLPGVERDQRAEDGRRIERIVVEDVPPGRIEPNAPCGTSVAEWLHVSTERSWQELAAAYRRAIEPQLAIDAYLERVAREVTSGVATPRERIERLRHWIVERIVVQERVLDDAEPEPAALVARRGFGDSFDVAGVLVALARAAGLEAELALARPRDAGPVDGPPASLDPFERALVWLPELEAYVDPGAPNLPTWTLPAAVQGASVLRMAEGEAAGIRTTPRGDPQQQRNERIVELRVARGGGVEVEVAETARGEAAARLRELLRGLGEEQGLARVQSYARESFEGVELEGWSARGLDDLDSAVELRYEGRIAASEQDEERVRLAPSVLADGRLRRWMPDPSRSQPLDLGVPRRWAEQRTIRWPRGWQVADTPPSGKVPCPFGTMQMDVERRADSVFVRTELELARPRIEPSRCSGLRAWAEAAAALLEQPVVLEEEPR